VAGTAGSASLLPDFYWDYTNSVLYVCTTTGTSSTAAWTAVNASSATPSVPAPQGRLTPTSGTPIISTDAPSAASVFYTPYTGNLVPIYNGSTMVPTEFAELTLTLAASHATNTIYDVFVYSNSGVLTLVTGPAWTSSTAGSGARGSGAATTQLTRVKGFWTNAVSMTGRNGSTTSTVGANSGTYLGSIFIDGVAGQVTCHVSSGQSRKWGVWNAYNRSPITLSVTDPTASWSNTSAAVRSSNGTASNTLTVLQGLLEELVDAQFSQTMNILPNSASGTTQAVTNGIGVNSVVAFTGMQGQVTVNSQSSGILYTVGGTATAKAEVPPALGTTAINALEQGNSAASVVVLYSGTSAHMLLTATWRG
jgi:hypothetical protein